MNRDILGGSTLGTTWLIFLLYMQQNKVVGIIGFLGTLSLLFFMAFKKDTKDTKSEEKRFIAFPKDRKDADGKEDFSLVYIDEDNYPCCREHGAMNRIDSKGVKIWRCFAQYGREKQEGETMGKFVSRVCNACCVEDRQGVVGGEE